MKTTGKVLYEKIEIQPIHTHLLHEFCAPQVVFRFEWICWRCATLFSIAGDGGKIGKIVSEAEN